MKKVGTLGPVVYQVETASRKQPYFYLTDRQGYRHSFLVSLGWVTSHDGLQGLSVALGPLHLTLGWALEHAEGP